MKTTLSAESVAYSPDDIRWMQQALALARRGKYSTHPNPAVGCVIVRDGKILGEGYHRRAGEPHAEVHALNDVAARTDETAAGSDIYVTLEPCAHTGRTGPCAEALVAAKPKRVVVAMVDPNPQVAGQGIGRLREAGIQVDVGIMQSEAQALNLGFCRMHETGRPYVRLKLAASLDGKTALENGESQWITSPEARLDVHRIRAASSAILTGSGTVIADNPSLTVRHPKFPEPRQPIPVVLDTKGAVDEQFELAQNASTLLYSSTVRNNLGATTIAMPKVEDHLDLEAVFSDLARRQLHTILVESGPRLAGSLLQAGWVDELVLYLAPKLLGQGSRGLFALPGLEKLTDAPALEINDVRAVGRDWRIIARPKNA